MFWGLFLQIVAGITGIYLAQRYVAGVDFTGPLFLLPKDLSELNEFMTTLVFVGALLGLLNHLVKPFLNTLMLPLRIVTLNLFSIVVAMFLVWLVNAFSPELTIVGLKPLFFTTLIVWAINFLLSKWLPEKHKLSAASLTP